MLFHGCKFLNYFTVDFSSLGALKLNYLWLNTDSISISLTSISGSDMQVCGWLIWCPPMRSTLTKSTPNRSTFHWANSTFHKITKLLIKGLYFSLSLFFFLLKTCLFFQHNSQCPFFSKFYQQNLSRPNLLWPGIS